MKRRWGPLFFRMLAAALVFFPDSRAQASRVPDWMLPDYLRLQFAGHTGFLSLGAGYAFWDGRLEPEILYGYVPTAISGKTIHTLSQKTTFTPMLVDLPHDLVLSPALFGFGANVALGGEYFLIPPPRYRNYYWPSALRLRVFAGMGIRKNLSAAARINGLGATVEVGTVDAYIVSWRRSDYVGLGDILSLAFSGLAYF